MRNIQAAWKVDFSESQVHHQSLTPIRKPKVVVVVLVDLIAAYDTVRHRGLTLKMLQMIPDRNLVCFIVEMILNHNFVLKTSSGEFSRLYILKNGVPQGSSLSLMLFNIYISTLPCTTAKQYCYADDLALQSTGPRWDFVESNWTLDMANIFKFLKQWKLKLSITKTTVTAIHFNSMEVNHKITISIDGIVIPNNH